MKGWIWSMAREEGLTEWDSRRDYIGDVAFRIAGYR